jgi:hypothetical protein
MVGTLHAGIIYQNINIADFSFYLCNSGGNRGVASDIALYGYNSGTNASSSFLESR